MTTEPDASSRRPPTIELTATEVAAERQASPPAETREPRAAEASAEGARGDAPRAEETSSASPTAASADEVLKTAAGERRGTSALTAFGAGVVGGLAAVAVMAGLWLADFLPPRPSAPTPPQTGGANSATTTAVAAVSARLDKIEKTLQARPAEPRPSDSAGLAGLTSLQAETKSLGDSLAALNRRADEIAATAQDALKQANAAAGAADAAKSAATGAAEQSVQRGDFDALGKRVSELESAVKMLSTLVTRQTASADGRAARLAVAASALRAAVEGGAPFAAELTAARSLGGVDDNAAAALQGFAADGVPSAAALARELESLLPTLTRAAEPTEKDATFLQRLENSVQRLIRITPVNAPAGNSPADVIARLNADAGRADIASALADIVQLPEPVHAPVADWVRRAQARDAAIAAARRISADAISALNKPAAP